MGLATQFRPERIHPSAFIGQGAVVVGDVSIGEQSSVWFNAVVRGDTTPIQIGNQTNIQDLALLHADPGFPCVIGDGVTVGHGAIVHGATVEDNVLIGMRAVVMNGATIGSGSVVGAGAVVTERMEVPPNSVVLGMPAKVVRESTPEARQMIQLSAHHYVESAAEYLAGSETEQQSGK